MILVDTSVWIDHLRRGEPRLEAALDDSQVLMHPMVLGELACGNLEPCAEVLALLRQLPVAFAATTDEALFFIERHALMGRGIGFVDVHLLASVALSPPTRLWTRDKRLDGVAHGLGFRFSAA